MNMNDNIENMEINDMPQIPQNSITPKPKKSKGPIIIILLLLIIIGGLTTFIIINKDKLFNDSNNDTKVESKEDNKIEIKEEKKENQLNDNYLISKVNSDFIIANPWVAFDMEYTFDESEVTLYFNWDNVDRFKYS